jgi:hypothetical protein
MAVGFRKHPSQATNDEVHLLQSMRFLRGKAPLDSTINEGQIDQCVDRRRLLPGSRHALRFLAATASRRITGVMRVS